VVTGPAQPRLPRWLVLAIAFVFVFIAGLCVPYRRSVRLEARLESATRALTLARLETTLGAAGLEARRGRYESGRQLASGFFSGLQQAVEEIPAERRESARAILVHRDSVITALSRGAATSADLLDRLLAQYREVARAGASAVEP
jgi:hypothetical protein